VRTSYAASSSRPLPAPAILELSACKEHLFSWFICGSQRMQSGRLQPSRLFPFFSVPQVVPFPSLFFQILIRFHLFFFTSMWARPTVKHLFTRIKDEESIWGPSKVVKLREFPLHFIFFTQPPSGTGFPSKRGEGSLGRAPLPPSAFFLCFL